MTRLDSGCAETCACAYPSTVSGRPTDGTPGQTRYGPPTGSGTLSARLKLGFSVVTRRRRLLSSAGLSRAGHGRPGCTQSVDNVVDQQSTAGGSEVPPTPRQVRR